MQILTFHILKHLKQSIYQPAEFIGYQDSWNYSIKLFNFIEILVYRYSNELTAQFQKKSMLVGMTLQQSACVYGYNLHTFQKDDNFNFALLYNELKNLDECHNEFYYPGDFLINLLFAFLSLFHFHLHIVSCHANILNMANNRHKSVKH